MCEAALRVLLTSCLISSFPFVFTYFFDKTLWLHVPTLCFQNFVPYPENVFNFFRLGAESLGGADVLESETKSRIAQ